MKKHFVTFYSPGTFVAETTTKPIDTWDPCLAQDMARTIVERYGAKPYGFRFTTRERGPEDLDSMVTDASGMFFLGGEVKTVDDLKGDPANDTLISYMKCNNWLRVFMSDAPWRWCQPLEDGDVVLPARGET